VLVAELAELVHLHARHERRVHLEVRVLRGRAHECDQPLLDGRQERVLLCLVEAVDLVEEEDRALTAGAQAVFRPLEHVAHLLLARVHGRGLLERGAGVAREHARKRRLARARRAVQDHRVRPSLLDRGPKGRPLAEQVVLADELVERLRAHPRSERLIGRGNPRLPARPLVTGVKELVRHV
jgi:hypothetical protein